MYRQIALPESPTQPARRHFVLASAAVISTGAMPMLAQAANRRDLLGHRARSVDLYHLHTGEQLSLLLFKNEMPSWQMYEALTHFMRDHYSGRTTNMDPRLLKSLFNVMANLDIAHGSIEIISGYRSNKTNARLRRRNGRVARNSFHTKGRAMDLRMPQVALRDLRDAARSEKIGGVGYYSRSRFVHFDTGPVRSW
jgi:uncharacterized protein YcbK (DUF882 family)